MIKFEQYLLNEKNFDLDQKLISASVKGDLDLVKKLIDQGADVHVEHDASLRYASEYGHLTVLKYLIEEAGANIKVKNYQALRLASYNGHLEIVKYLISKGADIHAEDDYALILALRGNRTDVIKYLLQKGANFPEFGIDIPDNMQEMIIKINIKNIKYIKNLRNDLKKKYKHLLIGSGFGLFDDD
jgi:ankyrin repeat protein